MIIKLDKAAVGVRNLLSVMLHEFESTWESNGKTTDSDSVKESLALLLLRRQPTGSIDTFTFVIAK